MHMTYDRTKRVVNVRRSLCSLVVAFHGHRYSVEIGRVFGPRRVVTIRKPNLGICSTFYGVGALGWGVCVLRFGTDRRLGNGTY